MVICTECKQPECVAIYGDDGCYEYALLDEDNQMQMINIIENKCTFNTLTGLGQSIIHLMNYCT